MLEKGKISAFQMGLVMYPTVLGTGFLALPTITAQYAKNDLWLTGIFASILGFITVYVVTRLHKLYPKMTVIQYSEHIVGKIPGKIIGMVFFLYSLHGTGTIARQYAEFVTGNFLFKTPILLIISSMVLFCAFAIRGGVELLARSATILTPIFILPIFFLLLLIPDLDVKNIFPILSHGMIPVIKGTATPQAWVSELFLMTFFLPSLADPGKGRKWGLISLCAIILSMTYVNLITLFLLGADTGNKTYPILVAFRYISFGNFFENLEALLLAMWVVGNFVKIGVFFYATVLSFGQWLNLSEYRPVIFPLGILIVVFGLWDLPDFPTFGSHAKFVAPFEVPAVLTFIPLLLLIVAVMKQNPKSGER
jgi:spore germination protein KB